jgi:hypothetical protein
VLAHLLRQRAWSGCFTGFFLGNRDTDASLIAQVSGGRERRVGNGLALVSGQLTSLELESNRHPVGLLFC